MNESATATTPRCMLAAMVAGHGHPRNAPPSSSDRRTNVGFQPCPGHATPEEGPYALPLHRRHRGGAGGGRRRSGIPRAREGAQAPRHRVREPDQDDDLAGHLLHDRARYRFDPAGRQGGPGRRARTGLLPLDVHDRAGDRAGGRQHPPAGHRPGPHRTRALRGAGGRVDDGVPARDHPDHALLAARRRQRALDAVRRAARRIRGPGARPIRRADPARRQARRAARLPRARDDHVGGADRRVRRDRRRGRRDRLERDRCPVPGDGRLLHHVRDLRVRLPRAGAAVRRRDQHLLAAALPRAGVPAHRLHVLVGVGAAAADREDGARRHLPAGRRHHGARPATRSTSTAPRST